MRILPGATRTWIDLSASGPFIDEANLNDFEAKFRAVDALLQAGAVAIQNAPPVSPTDGQVYVVGTAPTGAWAGQANTVTRYDGVAWEYFTPAAGWWISIGAQDYRYSGTAWVAGWTAPHGPSHEFGGTDPITGQNLLGLRAADSPEFARTTLGSELRLKRSGVQEWGMVAGSSGLEIASRNADWSAIDWPITIGHDAGGAIRLGGTTNRPVNLTYSLQLGGVDAITSTRAARFTGMRLTNLSSGQIPVCSDGNGEITASGQSDDGAYLTSSRIFRSYHNLTKTAGTWTAFQWVQASQERSSLFSSDASGADAYPVISLFPADTETANRTLGVHNWLQKVSGKSGTNPGIKLALVGQSIGAGGSTGGFGGQYRIEYRPDNGATLQAAIRIGAFGGSTADAVETAILLRALAGIQADCIRLGVETKSGNWSPAITTKRFVKQTGAGVLTLPVDCAAFAGVDFIWQMAVSAPTNMTIEKDTYAGEAFYRYRDSDWWNIYGGSNLIFAGVSPMYASGDVGTVHIWCDGGNWWIDFEG